MLASMLRRGIASVTLLVAAVPTSAAITRTWETVIPDAIENAFVVLDTTGNPRVISVNASGLLRYAALDRNGIILASGSFPAAADGNYHNPTSAAAAPDGGATACGAISIPPPSGPASDGLAVRFSASGTPLWNKVLDHAELGLCGLRSLRSCTTASGSIFGVGTAAPDPLPPFPGLPGPPPDCPFDLTNFKSFLVRLDEVSGAVTGLRTFSIIPDGAQYTAIASSGAAIYALGTRGSSMILDKYDLALNHVWTATAATSAMPISVAISSKGDISVLGQRGTLDARVMRFTPDGGFLGEAVIPFPESTSVALSGGATSYVTGRRLNIAALASASSADAVTLEFDDPAARRYLSVAVDGTNDIFATSQRTTEVRVARFAPAASTATSRLSISTMTDGQIGEVNANLPLQLEVRVLDASSAPAASVSVAFSVSSQPATGARASVTPANTQSTLPDGKASTVFKIGGLPLDYQVTCNCPTCGPTGSSVTFTACGKLGTSEFRQGDTRWRTTTLGNHVPNNSIGQVGCALSSVANLINFYNAASSSTVRTDPLQLNRDMIAQGGYDGADDVRWSAVVNFTAAQIASTADREIKPGTTRADLINDIDADVAQGRPVIIQGEHPPAGSRKYHFMLVVGKCGGQYIVADPGSPTGRRSYDPNEFNLPLRGIHRYAP